MVLLLQGIPQTNDTSSNPAPNGSLTQSAKGASDAVPNATEGPTSAKPARASATNYASLCLLGVALSCASPAAEATARTVPASSDPISAWTNITPPTGAANPPSRFLSSMVYYPSGHDDILFGGYGELSSGPWVFYNDTWSFVSGRWTELISNTSCTLTTCPSPRAGAMMAYYAPLNAILLFGGYVLSPSITYVAYSDTWLFYNGTWHNITTTAGTPPSPRYEGSMVWDSLDGYVVLFGGATASGVTLGDTWTFDDGTWTNITGSLSLAPEARAGAAIADSPNGYIMLFGGEENGVTILDSSCGQNPSQVDWWFYNGAWVGMPEDVTCTQSPAPAPAAAPAAVVNGDPPPCGRVNPALGWSPKNERFVLYGGEGPLDEADCQGFQGFLNDTWMYLNPPGSDFNWQNVSDSGDPPARAEMGYASDFTDNYFEIFGGYGGEGSWNDTWRFFEPVRARLSGPASIDTNATNTFTIPFTVLGYGGSGDLDYTFTIAGLRNANTLSGTGCAPLTTLLAAYPLPYDGSALVTCTPTPQSYNVYRLTVTVWDVNNVTDQGESNWTFTVIPPESAHIFGEYHEFFFANFDIENSFFAYLNVANTGATSVSATFGGAPLTFSQTSTYWWTTSSMDMASVAPGTMILLTADFPGWTVNTTYSVNMIETPAWMASLLHYAGATVETQGSGTYDKTYSIDESFNWDIGTALGFSIPVPLVGGDYSIIPSMQVSFSANSTGGVSLTGTLSGSTPSIDLGVFNLQLSASANLSGTFSLTGQGGGYTIEWDSAMASVSVSGTFSGSVPIYGFNILGVNVGFTLSIDVSPSVALAFVLAPTSQSSNEIASNIQLALAQLYGEFQLPISVSVNFGVGFASVGLGGTLSIAVTFHAVPNPGLSNLWVNGSVFAQASAFCWSDSWTLLGPATIYYTDPPGGGLLPAGSIGRDYDNGTNATWKLTSRYYAGSGYDANVWNASASRGPAISDIYPFTEVSGTAGYNGAYLFYTDDNLQAPAQDGLIASGAWLNASSNRLVAVPPPKDPGFDLYAPKATTLSDGSLYVVWDALPMSQAALGNPLDLTNVQLHGARYDPSTETWGPVTTFSSWGLAQSYALDGTTAAPTLAELIAPSFLLGASTPERLVEFDLTSGTEVANVSVTGLSEIDSVRGGLGEAAVRQLSGNYSVVDLATGATVPVAVSVPSGYVLVSESFVAGSASSLALLFRGTNASEVVLYDLGLGRSVATLPVNDATVDVEAVAGTASTYYLFAGSASGIEGWTEAGGVFQNLTEISEPHLKSFTLVQAGSALVVVSLVANATVENATITMTLVEIPASLPVVPGQPASSSTASSTSTSDYLLYLGIAAAAVAILLAVVAIVGRRKSRPPAAEPVETPPSESPPSPPWQE